MAEKIQRNSAGYWTASAATSGYDAVQDTKRRKMATGILRDEDAELKETERKKLLSTTHGLFRNWAAVGWAIRRHLDYVTTFEFQARTDDEGLNRELEDFIRFASRRQEFDIRERHGRQRFFRLLEAQRTIDGDAGMFRLRNGRVQGIESDRIGIAPGDIPADVDVSQFGRHGIRYNEVGKPLQYMIRRRRDWGGYEFERVVPAAFLDLYAHYHRLDQGRGVSPLASALNQFRDTYEATEYALAKMKISQLFGITFMRDDPEGLGHDSDYSEELDFSGGPIALDLDPGDEAKILESNTPSSEFAAFMTQVLQGALKALDIPYSFYDESFTNYSGSRQAMLQYELSASIKRGELRELQDGWTRWRLALALADGQFNLPRGMMLGEIRWEYIHRGIPWIDPLKEVKADIEAIKANLLTRTEVAKRRGRDFGEVIEESRREREALQRAGLNPEIE